jgi:ribonuclease VapC
MVVDASAILAIYLREDDAQQLSDRLGAADGSIISPINYWEVLARAYVLRGDAGVAVVSQLMLDLNITVVPADVELARRAAAAFARFRGRAGGRLNLGDCFAYALAEREGDGLLFKGNDFPKTDVKSALA